MANQGHGFEIENSIRNLVFRVLKPYPYTAIHDVNKEDNPFNPHETISIKVVTGTGAVCMSSAKRLFEYSADDQHTLIVVRMVQRDGNKDVKQVIEMNLDKKEMFGDVEYKDIEELDSMIRSVPRGEIDQPVLNEIHATKTLLNAKSGYVKFNPKLDSRSQRRLQCSIPSFHAVMKKYPQSVKSVSDIAILRGIEFLGTVVSARRKRIQKLTNLGF